MGAARSEENWCAQTWYGLLTHIHNLKYIVGLLGHRTEGAHPRTRLLTSALTMLVLCLGTQRPMPFHRADQETIQFAVIIDHLPPGLLILVLQNYSCRFGRMGYRLLRSSDVVGDLSKTDPRPRHPWRSRSRS